MNLKTTLALLILVGACVVLFYPGPSLPPALDPLPAPSTPASLGTTAFLDQLNGKKIERIEVSRANQQLILIRTKEGWSVPGNWPLRKQETSLLVDSIVGLRSRFAPIAVNDQQELKQFGLQPPAMTLTLVVDGNTHKMELGEPDESNLVEISANVGDRFARPTYLRLDGKMEVLRLAPGLLAQLDKPPAYFLQRRLFPGEKVERIPGASEFVERLLARNGVLLTIEDRSPKSSEPNKKADTSKLSITYNGSEWVLSQPARDQLAPVARDGLLEVIPDLWAERFVDGVEPIPLVSAVVAGFTPGSLPFQIFWLEISSNAEERLPWLLTRTGLANPSKSLTFTDPSGDSFTLDIGEIAG